VKFQTITGFRDILPPESALWNRVERTAREVFGTYGYGEIRLPILEPTELFARSIGAETDVVSKEMYSFEDYEHRDLAALRTLLVAKQPSISDPNFFWSYEMKATEFRERLRQGIDAGFIAKTPENRKTLEDLGPVLDSLAAAREQYEKTQDAQLFERFNLYVGLVRNYLLAATLGEDVTLRPEATASVVRAYIEHGMHLRPGNVKLYYIGPMFRRERPQKGRYRQFYQIGAELLGASDHPALDAEVIEMLMAFFGRLQLKGTTLYLNSIGDKNCRPAYVEKLREELRKVKDQLGPDSQRRIETNPLRVLDSKVREEQPIIANLPRIAEHLCQECKEHYAKLKQELALRGIAYEENWRLVRGLDYYMRTTFEITATGLGSQNAVCGGGRYDGLVELLGGPATTKGIGFAIGTDRLILSLEEAGQAAPKASIAVFLAWFGAPTYPTAVALARKLREQGIAVEMPAVEMKFGKSLSLADRLGARYAVILGEEELAAKQFTVKRLADGEQKKLSEADLLAYLQGAQT
jgi:histidyl-tRNA synthetase